MAKKDLALFGGKKAVQTDPGDIFRWPIITKEDEDAALEVLRAGKMSGLDVTEQFEREFAEWHGTKYALAHNTGTAALHSAMFACGVGAGDEIICQSLTYWASCLPAFSLGASIVFAEVNDTLTLEPKDIEKRISKRTKAIIAVHYCGYPTDMDPIMAVAKKHGIKVIEDVSHAHGALYKGRLVGTIGHVGAMSVMSGKALPVGEGGFLVTNDQEIYERSVAFGHYERTTKSLTLPELKKFAGLPQGGYKYRMHQISSAVGRVQLKHYRKRMEEIQKGMNLFWDLLEGVPGIKPHRPAKDSGSTMGGWYAPHGIYVPEQVGGLPVQRFCEAVRAEGVSTGPGANLLLHLHPVMNECDVYHQGKPTRVANVKKDIRQPKGSLPVSETMPTRCYGIPWFKHYRPQIIKEHALAFRKAAENADALR